MGELARKALKIIQGQGGRVIDHKLIDRTLREIGQEYKPGLLAWIKDDRRRWARLLDMEDRINQASLSGDEKALVKGLEEYREFFSKMIPQYEGKGHTVNLFEREI